MVDQFAAMRLFVRVAEAGSFTAAAKIHATPLATVSRQIAVLERRLGLPLFRRAARRLVLTEAGQAYLSGARRILGEVAELDASLAGQNASPQGLLAVTAPVAFGRLHVIPIVTEYLAANPHVRIRLLLLDRVVNLVEEGLDLAIRFGPPDESLVARPFGEQRSVVCASPDYLARRGAPDTPADLAAHDIVAFASVDEPVWRFAGNVAMRLAPRLVVNTAEAALDAAMLGVGIVRVMSYQASAGLHAGRLVRILEPYEPAPLPGHLVCPGGRHVPARLRSFVDAVLPRLRALAAG
jgi:DNA-binding transcriptional LysR family regulator